ncbi:hypothetical protein E6O75_ATG07654 [Venturia nashicola]|uniref:Uncharacterized protein n=1 Tax=Venturia nashicola TaxID=86259 RepID=A0A4Z1PCD5_9PEZI|nr:hypothetical protein E6O75_ATG07654 [Venturia nashicola]
MDIKCDMWSREEIMTMTLMANKDMRTLRLDLPFGQLARTIEPEPSDVPKLGADAADHRPATSAPNSVKKQVPLPHPRTQGPTKCPCPSFQLSGMSRLMVEDSSC